MKALFWIGLAALVLGLVLLVVPIPRTERGGIRVGDMSVGVETQHQDKVPAIVCAVIILGGAGMMIVGKVRS